MKKKYVERTMEFHKIYNEKILPIVKRWEFKRQEIKKRKDRKMLFGVLGLCSPLIWVVFIIMSKTPYFDLCSIKNQDLFLGTLVFSVILLILIGIFLLSNIDKEPKDFILSLKSSCLKQILSVFGNIAWQNGKNELIPNEELNATALFAEFNKRKTDDVFQGSYNGVDFKICETNLIHESGSGKNHRAIQVFKGVVITFKSNKKVKNRTIVATKGDITQKNGKWFIVLPIFFQLVVYIFEGFVDKDINAVIFCIVSIIFIFLLLLFKKDKSEKLDTVNLEDSVFAKKYNVYSSDQVEARYLLTTSFMERFQNLTTAFGTEKAKCSFYDGDKIMFAISTDKNLFEIGNIETSLLDSSSINTFYDELSSIYEMIEYFKFDEKTGL